MIVLFKKHLKSGNSYPFHIDFGEYDEDLSAARHLGDWLSFFSRFPSFFTISG